MTPFTDSTIQDKMESYPAAQKPKLLAMRELVYKSAAEQEKVGEISESLKWGQPTFSTKTGSPIRIDKIKDSENIAAYFICTTKLVDRFREIYPDNFKYVGNRSIEFSLNEDFDEEALSHCFAMALTYKLNS